MEKQICGELMAAGFVQVAPDSTGKKIQTFENTVGSEVVGAQAASLVDAAGVSVTPLTDAQLRAASVAVSVGNFPAMQAVSIETMPPTPVTGSFFQATQPVSIAAQVKAREDTAAMTWVSVKSAAPAANSVQATTGQLAAGEYDFDIHLCASDTIAVGKGLVIEHRNAADSATLFNLGAVPAASNECFRLRRYTIATNERIRIIAGTAAGAASSMYVSAIGRRVS